ncbi:MAG: glycosyltransferase family 4 protein [Chloroflexi bacterium]|nr:glycosyltransferase family 4 protein [Chloroflexota bacterium]
MHPTEPSRPTEDTRPTDRRAPDDGARLRIAFVYDALVPYTSGGAERRFHELATRLAIRHEVHYVTWRFWGDCPTMVRDGITFHGVGGPRQFYGSDGKRTIREAAEFALRLPATLARLKVDVLDVSATPYLPLYTAWAVSRATRTPLVATWHEFWGAHWATYLPDRPVVARLARLSEAAARPLSDRRVAVSAFTARRMSDPGRRRDSIDVVGNGVDLVAMADARPDPESSDILFVGRLIDEKQVDLLVRAVAALHVRAAGLRCVIAGDGPERDRLVSLAADLGVGDQVVFVGRVQDGRIPELMRSSRILVLPSAREGYGITVVEGGACGLVPVVTRSPLSAAPDLVTDGRDGLICDPTVDGLAGALGSLLADPERLARMALAARQSADERGWDSRAMDMERIYREVALRRRPALAGPAALALDGAR